MTNSIGSFGPIGTSGLVNGGTAVDHADPAVDATDAQPEHAAGVLAAMKPPPSRVERERLAQPSAEPAQDDSTELDDDGPYGTPVLDMAPQAASMAAMVERVVQAPLQRLPSDATPIRRIDRRRKRSC